jgi:uncharacterized membrane protein HdeD (DUF308 family)
MGKNGAGRAARVSGAAQLLIVGAIGICAGIALSVTESEDVGAVLTLVGLALLLLGLHRFGRLGADPPGADHLRSP